MNYIEHLINSSEATNNIAVMGLDPKVEALPEGYTVESYILKLLEEMHKRNLIPAAFKPNIGYYTALDCPLVEDYRGSKALAHIIKVLPNVPLILDAKRGDISSSSLNYAIEAFRGWIADAVTVSPYMGNDSISPFVLNFPSKGIYILTRTSNPGGKDLQNLILKDGSPLYMSVASTIVSWNKEYSKCIGGVVGATNLKEFEDIVTLYGPENIPILIPGVGSQGGDAKSVISIMKKVGYPLSLARINSSSALTHPWAKKKESAPQNWLDVCIKNIETFLEECEI